ARSLREEGIIVTLINSNPATIMTDPVTADNVYLLPLEKKSIKKILTAGIPVMGHLGLTPQSIYKFGTYTVRAKGLDEAQKLREDAKFLDEMGCFAMVLEKIPAALAKEVSESIHCPTIGIGAGMHCDGQVLVTHDMLGITKDFKPRFLRRYLELFDAIGAATQQYVADVKGKNFPNESEQY
ncbi:MAG: 3-methyl-2-oxobutanoate hydroxymethyltransferase, partial [Saprospiraceae bacterium]